MIQTLIHEIELYPLEKFRTLLEHEARKSRRYKHPLSLIHLAVEAEPAGTLTQHAAEMVAINELDAELRDTDIPCWDGNEFLVLLPSTGEEGARRACERLEKLFGTSHQIQDDGIPFQVAAFIGLTTTNDLSATSPARLLEEAASALNHARLNRSVKTVVYSEIE